MFRATPPIIRSLKLHKQPLVLHTWKVVRRAVVGFCQVAYATWQRPQPYFCRKLYYSNIPLCMLIFEMISSLVHVWIGCRRYLNLRCCELTTCRSLAIETGFINTLPDNWKLCIYGYLSVYRLALCISIHLYMLNSRAVTFTNCLSWHDYLQDCWLHVLWKLQIYIKTHVMFSALGKGGSVSSSPTPLECS